jgi:hypothetical protein
MPNDGPPSPSASRLADLIRENQPCVALTRAGVSTSSTSPVAQTPAAASPPSLTCQRARLRARGSEARAYAASSLVVLELVVHDDLQRCAARKLVSVSARCQRTRVHRVQQGPTREADSAYPSGSDCSVLRCLVLFASGGLEAPGSNPGAPIGETRWKRRVSSWPRAKARARVCETGVWSPPGDVSVRDTAETYGV